MRDLRKFVLLNSPTRTKCRDEQGKQPEVEEKDEEPKLGRQQLMQLELDRYLKKHYRFRYNLLTERAECINLLETGKDTAYRPVDSRVLNSVALNAMSDGVECWDRDVKRYVESDRVDAYHPFTLYFRNLPSWDGTDRVTELAREFPERIYGCARSTAGCWPLRLSGRESATRADGPTVWLPS